MASLTRTGPRAMKIFANEIPLSDASYTEFTRLVAREDVRPKRPEKTDDQLGLTNEIWALAERCWTGASRNLPTTKELCKFLVQMVECAIRKYRANTIGRTSNTASFGEVEGICPSGRRPDGSKEAGRSASAGRASEGEVCGKGHEA